VKGAIRLDAVIMRPLLAPRLLLGRRERRYAFPVLRILHHEPFRGLREGDDVVTLSEKMHPFAVEDLQHLLIGRHVVGFQEGLARDRYQLPIEDSLSDAIGAPVPFVAVVRPQHSFENRLELSLGVFGFDMFVSSRGHVSHPKRKYLSARAGAVRSCRRTAASHARRPLQRCPYSLVRESPRTFRRFPARTRARSLVYHQASPAIIG
jgi:hypothetical protein